MNRRYFGESIVSVLAALACLPFIRLMKERPKNAVVYVPRDYPTLDKALNAVGEGSTIRIMSGYHEHRNKPIYIPTRNTRIIGPGDFSKPQFTFDRGTGGLGGADGSFAGYLSFDYGENPWTFQGLTLIYDAASAKKETLCP